MTSKANGSDDNVTIIFPYSSFSLLFVAACQVQKGSRVLLHLQKTWERIFKLLPFEVHYIVWAPLPLAIYKLRKHHLPNNLSFKGLEIRAGWLVIKVLLTGSWVSMCVSQIRSMRDVWRAQRGLLVLSACSMGIWCMLELFYLIRQLIFLLQVCSNGKLYRTGQRDRPQATQT